jgi:glycosyltransferase involved in cell wall biosynthesis
MAATGISIEYFSANGHLDLKAASELAKTLQRYRVAVAHSHEFTMAVYGALAARVAGIPHVITMHGSRYYAQRVRRRLALRLAVESSGSAVAVSHDLAQHVSRDLWIRPGRILTIPNGVSFTLVERSSLREELGLGPGDRLAIAVGNLYRVKGHAHLLEALGLLHTLMPELHVAIAGRGEMEGALRARADELGLSERFHLLGLRRDVANILAAADVFVLPSLSEGLPLALLEAMTARCPIVAADVGEVRAALDDGRVGLLVPAGNPTSLAAALARLITDPNEAQRLGAAAARRAAAEYGFSRMTERYAGVYAGLVPKQLRSLS